MENLSNYWDIIIKAVINYLPKLLLAIIVLFIGLWIIKRIMKIIDKLMDKNEVDVSLHNFLHSLASVFLKVLLIISVISIVGVATSSFIAILASAGLAIGLALQGSLANFAGGVLILLLKPFKVGDYIDTQGFNGTVKSIQIFNTVLVTPDNKRVLIPNGNISNNAIINYTAEDIRRLDLSFGIAYNDDVEKAKQILDKVTTEDDRILKEPEKLIAIGQLADSSVNITVRLWCKTDKYWDIFFEIQEKVKKEFDNNGISIPFPQRDIHIYNH